MIVIRIEILLDPSPAQKTANTAPSIVVSKPESEAEKAGSDVAGVALSPDLERELCLAVNRELHVSYCYLVMGGIFTRQGLKSFSGMCERQVMMMIMMMMMMMRMMVMMVVVMKVKVKVTTKIEPPPVCPTANPPTDSKSPGQNYDQTTSHKK